MTLSPNELNAGPHSARRAILVLGMHRSGTSALARTLNLLGCDLPKTLVAETDSNKAGHWESMPISRLNDELLESAGTNWHDWLPFNPDWVRSPKAAEFRQRAQDALAAEFGGSFLFVLKDPRICRMTRFWLETLEDFGARPAIFFIVRNPLEVAESLKKRDGFDTALGHLLWLRNVLDSEFESRGRARFIMSYDGLLSHWGRLLKNAQETLGVTWPRKPSLINPEIDNFLSAGLHHHHRTLDAVVHGEMVSEWLRGSYEIVDRWSREGENENDYAQLDRIRRQFDETAPAFARLIALGNYHRNQSARLEQSFAEAEGRIIAAKKEADALRDKVAATESALRQRSHEAEQVTLELSESRKAIAASTREADALRDKVARLEEQSKTAFETSKKEADEARGQLAAQKAAHHSAEARLADANLRLGARFSEVATLTRIAHEKEQEAAQARQYSAEKIELALKALLDRPYLPALRRWQARQRAAQLNATGIFDADYYLRNNTDVAEAGIDPARHYIEFGMREGRPPNNEIARALGRE